MCIRDRLLDGNIDHRHVAGMDILDFQLQTDTPHQKSGYLSRALARAICGGQSQMPSERYGV
eukprot:7801724-Lingulodinium_polyedra.AAC.1